MAKRKSTKKYYFSVEGETEQWYLLWLRDLINSTDEAAYKVSFDCKIEKDPLKRAKGLTVTGKTEIYHISDYESEEEYHVRQFTDAMDRMKEATKLGKQIVYKFGYSNFTFEENSDRLQINVIIKGYDILLLHEYMKQAVPNDKEQPVSIQTYLIRYAKYTQQDLRLLNFRSTVRAASCLEIDLRFAEWANLGSRCCFLFLLVSELSCFRRCGI